MKRNLLIAFVVLSLVLSTVVLGGKYLSKQSNVVAENVDMNHTISVSGVGVVQTVPDLAVIDFGITVQQKTATDAMDQVTKIANKTVAVLKNAGVNSEDLKTTNISLVPVYQWDKEKNASILVGYKASESFELRVAIKDAGRMVGLISTNGVNNIFGIRFDVSDRSALEEDAITKAMENAKSKAEAALKNSNYKIVGIKTVSINSYTPIPIYRNSATIPSDKENIPVESGSMSIKAQVQVIFTFD